MLLEFFKRAGVAAPRTLGTYRANNTSQTTLVLRTTTVYPYSRLDLLFLNAGESIELVSTLCCRETYCEQIIILVKSEILMKAYKLAIRSHNRSEKQANVHVSRKL